MNKGGWLDVDKIPVAKAGDLSKIELHVVVDMTRPMGPEKHNETLNKLCQALWDALPDIDAWLYVDYK